MTSEFRIIKSLEWCPELPSPVCPRNTPVFTVNGNEWLRRFALEEETRTRELFYNLYAVVTCKNTEFEPCCFKLQVGFKKEESLILYENIYELTEPCKDEIWNMLADVLRSKLPSDYLLSNGIKFLFSFDNTAEHLLRFRERIGE